MMRITIVGCGDAFGSGGRFQSATLVESAAGTCLVDCGASTMTALNAQHINPDRIETILLTHLHGDHFGGIPFFLLDAQWVRRRTFPLLIAGPPGTRQRVHDAIEIFFAGTMAKTKWTFDWRVMEIAPDHPAVCGGYSIRTTAVDHDSGAPSTAVRLEADGYVFVHSGDTKWTDALLAIARGADLFFVDCYAFDTAALPHMSYRLLVEKRASIHASRVVLTHLGPDMLAKRHDVNKALFELAQDGAVYELQHIRARNSAVR